MNKIIMLASAVFIMYSVVFSPCIVQAREKQEKYSMIVFQNLVDFFATVKRGAEDAAVLIDPKIEITVYGPPTWNAKAEAAALMKQAKRKDVRGIFYTAGGRKELNSAVQTAIKNGIPVIAFDADAPESQRLDFVGTNNYNAGCLAGETIVNLTNKKGAIGVSTNMGPDHLDARVRGMKDTIAKLAPEMKVYALNDKGLPENSYDVAKELLTGYPDLTGILVTHSLPTKMIAKAVDDLKLDKKVQILGFDIDPETIKLIKNFKVYATVVQDNYLMGYVSMILTYHAAHMDKLPDPSDRSWRIAAISNFIDKNRDKLDAKLRDKLTSVLEQVKTAKKDEPIDTGVGIYTAANFANLADDPLLKVFEEEFR